MPEDDRLDRRTFFREGLRRAIKPLADAALKLDKTLTVLQQPVQSGATPPIYPSNVPANVWLRPPGALPEKNFLDTCSRCRKCIEVCPAHCIKIDVAISPGAIPIAGAAPYIDADAMPCVVCESLACMNVCPSGALVPTALFQIRMGTAVWREESCIRSKNEECRACVEKCPIGAAAIDVIAGKIVVNPINCVGCGVCQHYCPTSPKSIVVIPIAARQA